jgi:hypothetical protein
MPLDAPGKPLQKQSVRNFFGVNLRVAREDIPQGGLAKGLNVDLYEEPGGVQVRRGIASAFTQSGDGPTRKIVKANGFIYHASNMNFEEDGNVLASTLTANQPLDMVVYRGQRAQREEVFIANGTNGMRRFTTGAVLGNWGIAAPLAAPDVAAGTGGLTGTYSAKYTYVRKDQGTIVSESNPSAASADQALTAEGLDVDVVASTDSEVTHIRIYRTVASGSVYLFDQEVTNATATVTSTNTDAALGAAVDEDNDRPPNATVLHVSRDRIWCNNIDIPNRLHYSKRFFPESFPATNFVDIGQSGTITGISSINGVVVVFTETTKFRVIEQSSDIVAVGDNIPFIGASVAGFQVLELPSSRGTQCPGSIISKGDGLTYVSKDGVFRTTAQGGQEQLLSAAIQSIFLGNKSNDIPPIDWDKEANIEAGWHRGRYYFSYTSTEAPNDANEGAGDNDITAIYFQDADKWYFWDWGATSYFFDDGEDDFYAGHFNGGVDFFEKVDAFEDRALLSFPTTITAVMETPDQTGGDIFVRKLFLYLRVDATVVNGDTLTADFLVDGVSKQTYTITGTQSRTLLRIPAGAMGYTWRVKLTYSGSGRGRIHGVEAQFRSQTSS